MAVMAAPVEAVEAEAVIHPQVQSLEAVDILDLVAMGLSLLPTIRRGGIK
jgi:hypothetical protein